MTFQNDDPQRKCIITILTTTASTTMGRRDKIKRVLTLNIWLKGRKQAIFS